MGTNPRYDSPISQLHLEILGEIFVLAKSSTLRSRDNGALKSEGGWGWLNVVGVCRTWREIALNMAQMWNGFDISHIKHVEWALLLLARSKDAPLFVECANPCKNTDVLCALAPHLPRIQELYLRATSSQILSFFGPHRECMQAAKGLRCLGLRPLDDASSPVIEGVLKIDMSFLSCLELIRIDLPASIPCLPLLRRLYIRSTEDFCNMTVDSLMLSLRSVPSLEELEIIHTLLKPTALSIPTVDLPKLSRISLASRYFETSLLFQHIHYPPSSSVEFLSADSSENIPQLAALVSYFARSDPATQINGLTLMNVVCNHWSFSACVADTPSLQLQGYPNHFFDPRQFTSAFKLYALLPCLHNIRTLHICGFCKVSNQDWIDLYTRCPNIHHLTVTLSAKHCLGIMKQFPRPPDQEINDVALPQLKKLTLRRCSFKITYLALGFTAALAEFLKDQSPTGALSTPWKLPNAMSRKITFLR